MTLYFDTKAQFLDSDAVSTVFCCHLTHPLFAVASYNQNQGASVTIFDDSVNTIFFLSIFSSLPWKKSIFVSLMRKKNVEIFVYV